MDVVLTLAGNLVPLYALIVLGYIAGKFFNVDRQTLGALGIYIIMPIVTFGYVAQMEFRPSYIALPVVFYAMITCVCFIWLAAGKKVYGDSRANLMAISSASGNTGYFGLPLALMLLPEEWVGVYIFANLGALLFEATILYYLAARGRFSVRESLIKLARFPTIYAVAAGVAYNLSGTGMADVVVTYWEYFKGSYVVIGMMIIGAALAKVKRMVWAPRFISLTFAGKFIMLPLISVGLIMLDQSALHLFDAQVHKIMFILTIVPIGANIAAFAVEMDLKPEKAASTILYSTVFALISIPFSLYLYENFIAITP